MEIFFTILIMTLVVSLSGVVTRVLPFQVPLPLMQIAIGALLAWPTFGLHVEFDPELFLVLFIPPLLFADGWKTPTREFIEHGREIFGLALALVVVTVVGIGFLIYWIVPGIPLVPAFALAAVLSPTDAVALSGIVGEGRIPKKIMGILQGEALMNDASGLVSLKFAVAVAMGTMVFTIGGATVEFLKVAIGGILAGFVVSWLYGRSMRFLSRWGGDEPATQIVLLFLLPFASYLIAEHIGFSVILAADTKENIDNQLLTEVSSRVIGNLRRRVDGRNDVETSMLEESLERRFRLAALRSERGELYHLRATRQISNETLQKLLHDLDLLEALLIEDQ